MLKSFQAISISYSFSEIVVGYWELFSCPSCKFVPQLYQLLCLLLYGVTELFIIKFSIVFFHSIQFWCKYKETGRLSQAAQSVQLLSYETKFIANIKNPSDFRKQEGLNKHNQLWQKTTTNIPILLDKTMPKLLKVRAILEVCKNNTIKLYKVLQMSKIHIYYFVIYMHSWHFQYPVKFYSITPTYPLIFWV